MTKPPWRSSPSTEPSSARGLPSAPASLVCRLRAATASNAAATQLMILCHAFIDPTPQFSFPPDPADLLSASVSCFSVRCRTEKGPPLKHRSHGPIRPQESECFSQPSALHWPTAESNTLREGD